MSDSVVFPRRDFLKLLGLGVAGAAAGCATPPADRLIPYLVAPNDVLSIEAQESRQRMLAIQVRAARDVTAAELARLVGLPPGAAIEPAAALEPPAPETLAIDALIETARGRRADRAALLKRAEAAGERARAAVAGTKPALSAAGGFDYASPNPRIFPREERWRTSWDVSLNASWQLFDGGKVHADAAEAAALARAARARLADLDAALDLEIRQRATELDSSSRCCRRSSIARRP